MADQVKILVVEDEFIVAQDIKDNLISMGYTVTGIVESGEKALDTIIGTRPDVVLMDIMLRGRMTGIATANQIRSEFNIPVIFLSSRADREIIVQATRAEPFWYLIKPFKSRDLEVAIEMALYKFRMEMERKELEKELLKGKKLESLSVLAGGLAHDYNNILTAVMGNISLAQMYAEPDGKIFKLLGKAEDALSRARDLTRIFYMFTEGSALNKNTTSIHALIRNTIDISLNSSKVEYELDIADTLWYCEIDEVRIGQAIHKMIINALESMPEGGKLTINADNFSSKSGSDVSVLKNGNYVRICVMDQGEGIPEEIIDKIFDPYFTTKEKGSKKGIGLGLTIAHSIIRHHGGYIFVKSREEGGTTFEIYLPANDKKGIKKMETNQAEREEGKKRILVVDDEDIIRDVATQMLSYFGYKIDSVADGKDAVAIYEKMKETGRFYDLVILDLSIPGGLGGVEALKEIKRIDPSVKAVISSGYSNDDAVTNYQDYGFCGVVNKPYKMDELGRIVEALMKKNDQ